MDLYDAINARRDTRAEFTGEPVPEEHDLVLQVPYVQDGDFLPRASLTESRDYHAQQMKTLPREALKLLRGYPILDVDVQYAKGQHP